MRFRRPIWSSGPKSPQVDPSGRRVHLGVGIGSSPLLPGFEDEVEPPDGVRILRQVIARERLDQHDGAVVAEGLAGVAGGADRIPLSWGRAPFPRKASRTLWMSVKQAPRRLVPGATNTG